MAPMESKNLAQYQMPSDQDQRYGRRCWTSWKVLTSVRSDTRAPSFGFDVGLMLASLPNTDLDVQMLHFLTV